MKTDMLKWAMCETKTLATIAKRLKKKIMTKITPRHMNTNGCLNHGVTFPATVAVMAFQGIKHRFCGEQLMKASTCATRMKIVAALTTLPTVLLRTVSREAVTSLILRAHVM